MGKNHKETNPYFALHHGFMVSMNELRSKTPVIKPALDSLIDAGEIVGQRILTFDGQTEDMLVWMPKRMEEREVKAQEKLAVVRAELRAISRGISFENESDNVLEEGKPIDIR